jgi:hypothetical protein
MQEPAPSHGALDRFALDRLGEMLRGHYHLPATLPSRVYDLVTKLDRPWNQGSPSIAPDAQDLPVAAKESHYRRQAVETMRAAQHASSANARSRLVNLAEAWIELAEASKVRQGRAQRRSE